MLNFEKHLFSKLNKVKIVNFLILCRDIESSYKRNNQNLGHYYFNRVPNLSMGTSFNEQTISDLCEFCMKMCVYLCMLR